MKRVINREEQEGSFNLNWLVVAALTLIFVVPAVSKGAEPNATTRKVKEYHIQKDDSDELMKDKSGNFIFVPVYEDEPSEVPPVVPPVVMPTTQPSALSAALGTRLQRTSWDIGPEIYSFKYEEPGLMEEEGIFYGVRFGYTSRSWAGSLPDKRGGIYVSDRSPVSIRPSGL